MNNKAKNVLGVLFLALIAVIALKLLGFAINVIVSVIIPLLVIYVLYKIIIKKEDIFY
ncbi:hypothetical protein HV819_09000 [Anaerococcus sp. AGMB00486]|uniref:Uncharacterized protein n=1 Tax=Anaerococcus faecalis TaxID=2742993 RepID=A0ABX2NBM8_9FIRM|nr:MULTISPECIES: hypothetical protein [Anaerococcus]MDY3006616.1 hypothetical protein [Anaerococcus porci]NVF12111.1 hypothetical protein [Anaerococcus faecalis]